MPERISALSANANNRQNHVTTRSWFIPLMMRLHFYIGLFVGPFLLIAALSGIFYALTPQIESHYYAEQLYNRSHGPALSLGAQIRAAQADAPPQATLSAVRPAPAVGENTRVLFNMAGLQPSERLAVFVDPVTADIHGKMTVYGTSGILPLRTWLDQLHRSLLLGDIGRYYSELAASWLWIAALGGLILWRAKRNAKKGLRAVHRKVGLFVLIGLLFFSATGLTWSKWAGDNISILRQQLGWATPSIATALSSASAETLDEHAEHRHHAMPKGESMPVWDVDTYDRVLQIARQAGINADKLEIKQPASSGVAWTVSEIDRRWPTQVDAVAVDAANSTITDHVRFEHYPLAAKLTRWGIDLHMGVLFGWVNTLVLVVFAAGLAAMVIMGYLMWWRRRAMQSLRDCAFPLLRHAPKGPLVAIITLTLLVGFCLPVMGASLLLFLLIDWLRYCWQKQH
ncbi:PepSY-associated TM helix domain-containing protein [Serratia sp. NPDC078593]|uniref:PepSY-associated TM helix domain-containing protein n=1 Tax=unclassified Serratia (in: enterobacteria) TaxID=2647522 RepID=UPI0037D30EF8